MKTKQTIFIMSALSTLRQTLIRYIESCSNKYKTLEDFSKSLVTSVSECGVKLPMLYVQLIFRSNWSFSGASDIFKQLKIILMRLAHYHQLLCYDLIDIYFISAVSYDNTSISFRVNVLDFCLAHLVLMYVTRDDRKETTLNQPFVLYESDLQTCLSRTEKPHSTVRIRRVGVTLSIQYYG